ncbi:MAG: translation initiation factor IF-2 [Myxococcota bacterium]
MSSSSAPSSTSSGSGFVAVDGRALSLRSIRVDVECRAGTSRVELRQVFVNPHADGVRGRYKLPLPARASLSGLQFRVDGRQLGRTKPKPKGGALVHKVGPVPAGAELEVAVTLEHRLARAKGDEPGTWEWRMPGLVSKPAEGAPRPEQSLVLTIGDGELDGEPRSPSHGLVAQAVDEGHRVGLAGEGPGLEREVVVRWTARTAAEESKPARGDGPRVRRNKEGVIVGTGAPASGPKVVGFISLPTDKRKGPAKKVVVTNKATEAPAKGAGDGRASQRKRREERRMKKDLRHRARGRRGREDKAPPGSNTAEMSEKKKKVRVDGQIRVSDLARGLSQGAAQVLRVLWSAGHRGVTLNDAIDVEAAELVAAEFGYTVENVAFQEEELIGGPVAEGELRPPVVAVMGHVDHGKTTLLDRIRNTKVAAGEAGGITQHMGAQRVSTEHGDVVFLDTPGHEAFSAMRERGAEVTDIVLLVVAADDGVMPTTIEAIKQARQAKVPMVVALNKIDKPQADPQRVSQSLMEWEIVGEAYGGDVPILPVSAKTGEGLEGMLETLALQAEVLELRAPVEGRARGAVLEARVDKGRGAIATVLVQSGTLSRGDLLVVGELHGKVRGLIGADGKTLRSVGPSTPVDVLGLSGLPAVGETFDAVDKERDARALVSHRREKRLGQSKGRAGPSIEERLNRGKRKIIRIVLKADVGGSAQALSKALEELGDDEIEIQVLQAEVGGITEADIKYAEASDAMVMGFGVKAMARAMSVAEADGVKVQTFKIIYEALEALQESMQALREPEFRERDQGEAEIRALFPIPSKGVVAGCRVVKGVIERSSRVRVVRDGEIIHDGTIASLRIFEDDVREVKDGFECGIMIDGFSEVQEGDTIKAYALEQVPPGR